jgi:CBS domain-containing protein
MNARDVMTAEPACCLPTDTIQQAAKLMVEADCGCIPVVEDMQSKKIVGTLNRSRYHLSLYRAWERS